MNTESWRKVSRRNPCPICGKPDWCMISPDGDIILCNRVESDKRSRGGGWLHESGATVFQFEKNIQIPALQEPEKPWFDAEIWWGCGRHLLSKDPSRLNWWANELSLPAPDMAFMGAVALSGMLAFPMYDGEGKIIGIRTRSETGQKKAITGSKAGVFLPTVHMEGLDVVICEGPTDATAALSLGFEPIGRPSCIGQEDIILATLKRWKVHQVTICSDNDTPGFQGSKRLCELLQKHHILHRLVTSHTCKDLREWLKNGATHQIVQAVWSQAQYR